VFHRFHIEISFVPSDACKHEKVNCITDVALGPLPTFVDTRRCRVMTVVGWWFFFSFSTCFLLLWSSDEESSSSEGVITKSGSGIVIVVINTLAYQTSHSYCLEAQPLLVLESHCLLESD